MNIIYLHFFWTYFRNEKVEDFLYLFMEWFGLWDKYVHKINSDASTSLLEDE